ncbi:MAG: transcription elongation factor GreB [Spirochaetae bacterium HGW-Spirochaetae-9]|nr:MAG: transcription elongation factor GreB [Spirochaetae bacterium HGW-Spirochaetae-9]
MSRAFVDEDAGSDETDGMHEIPLPLPPGAKNYMTPEGAMRMADELRSLVDSERPQAAGALAAAVQAAKSDYLRKVSEIDRRISYLSRMKSMLAVVDPPSGTDRVVFGLVVRVREEGSTDGVPSDVEYRIVGVDESDPEKGYVSWASPVAKALIGKKVGDTVSVRLPLGERMMKILGIRFEEPER